MAAVSLLPVDSLPDIVSRYAQGESLTTLAAEHHVNRSTVYRWILGGLGDQQHHDLITACLINRVCEADQALDTATDAIAISRAREQARFYRMDLERRRPGLYGSRVDVTVSASAELGKLLEEMSARKQGRLIEQEK